MKRRRYLTAVGTGVTVGLAGLAGCGAPADQTETEGSGATTETTAATTETDGAGEGTGTETTTGGDVPDTVQMLTEGDQYLFDPVGLYVESGETVTWVNESGSHSSTAYTEDNPQSEVRRIPDDADGWDSGTLTEEGAEFTHTFDVSGTYDYYCIPHKSLGMVARLVVDEPSGLESDPPDGPVPAEQTIVDQGVVTQDEFTPE